MCWLKRFRLYVYSRVNKTWLRFPWNVKRLKWLQTCILFLNIIYEVLGNGLNVCDFGLFNIFPKVLGRFVRIFGDFFPRVWSFCSDVLSDSLQWAGWFQAATQIIWNLLHYYAQQIWLWKNQGKTSGQLQCSLPIIFVLGDIKIYIKSNK